MYSLWSNLFFYIFFCGSRLRRGVGLTAHASSSPSFFFFFFFFVVFLLFSSGSHSSSHTHTKKDENKKKRFSFLFFRSRHKQTDRQTHGRTDARTDRQPRDKTATDAIDLLGRLFPLWRAARWPVDTPLVDSFSLSLSLSFYSSFSLDTQRPIWRRNHRAFIGVPSRFVDFIYLFISFLSPFVDSVLYRVFFFFCHKFHRLYLVFFAFT